MTTPTPHGQVPEALRLAEEISNLVCSSEAAAKTIAAAADELCRLHVENASLRASLAASPTPPAEQPVDTDGEAFRNAARLGLTLRFYGSCAQSSMPGTPSAYVVTQGGDRAEAMREAVEQAAAIIANGGEAPKAPLAPPAEQQDRWVERWHGSGGKEFWEGWSILNAANREMIAHLGPDVDPDAVRGIVAAHNEALCGECAGTGGRWCPACAGATPTAEQQAAPKAAPGVGNSGFDHQTAADFLSGKTVNDEAVRKFVQVSRWAHDEKAALSATLLAMHGVLTSREAEIALLKKALLEAEAPPQQEAKEPVMIYHGRCTIDCGEHGHHDMEMQRMIPAGSKLYTAPQPAPAPLSESIDQLARKLEIIGVVGVVDGHDVVRRESVLEIARRAALAAQGDSK